VKICVNQWLNFRLRFSDFKTEYLTEIGRKSIITVYRICSYVEEWVFRYEGGTAEQFSCVLCHPFAVCFKSTPLAVYCLVDI
jgi:hypothetical protein